MWSASTSGTTTNLQAVAHGGGTFVAVGNNGVILTSTDAATWTLQQKTSGSEMVNYVTSNLFGVGYGGNKFVAVGDLACNILTSSDGTTWTLQQKIDSTTITVVNYVTSSLNGVTYGGGKFVAVGARGNILTSTDGTTWTLQQKTDSTTMTMVNYTSAILNDVVYASNKFVAVGANGTVLTSSDGASWTIQTTPTTNDFSDVAYGDGTFAAVGFSGEINTSSDAITWTRNQKSQLDRMSMTVMVNYTASRIGALAYYGAGSFILGDFSGKIFQSSTDEDGVVTWTTNSMISPASLAGTFFLDMTYGSGRFVAVASGGLIFTRLAPHDYTCMNGTIAPGKTNVENTEKCTACNTGYLLADDRCVSDTTTIYPYVCTNGTAAQGMSVAEDIQKCTGCNPLYRLQGGDLTCSFSPQPEKEETSGSIWVARDFS